MGIRVTAKNTIKHQHCTLRAKQMLMSLLMTLVICCSTTTLLFYIRFAQHQMFKTSGDMLCYKSTVTKEDKQQTDELTPEYIKKKRKQYRASHIPIAYSFQPQSVPSIDKMYEYESCIVEGLYPDTPNVAEDITSNEAEDLIAFFNLCNEEWIDEAPAIPETKPAPITKKDVQIPSDYRPPQYLATPKPIYPPLLKRKRIQGEVRVRIHVNELGKASKVEILQSSHDDFAEAAKSRILADWRFIPAQRNGKAVADVVVTSVIFE